MPSIIIKANKLTILILCPLINITPSVPDNAIGIPKATQKATLPDKNKNRIITTKINPPSPFLISKLIRSLTDCTLKSYIFRLKLIGNSF